MAEQRHLPSDQSLEYHLVTLFDKLETLRNEEIASGIRKIRRAPLSLEIRSLDFWRSVISECLASFVYVFVVCGAMVSSGGESGKTGIAVLATAIAAGCAMTSLTQCFAHISGAHVNPAVTIAMGVTKNITLLRTTMFIIAQCGGGIAGAAFLYGVTFPNYQANLASIISSTSIQQWERFGMELILTFIIVFSYFVSMDTRNKWMSSPALTIGATYSACSFVSMPCLNPARSLGPSFVLNRWESHWVFWIAPSLGGIASGLIYKYIFNSRRVQKVKDASDGESSSIHSDEDTYDDLDKPAPPKFHGSTYNTYRSTGQPAYCSGTSGLYSGPHATLERVESLYGGTKSMYCKSPPLTRANLHRSQSVYTKSNTTLNRDVLLKPGPLVPAQSLYPMRLNQQSHVQNQNLQNQMQQRSECLYGPRGVTPGTARSDNFSADRERNDRPPPYGMRGNILGSENGKGFEDNGKVRGNRPESMYGMVGGRRAQNTPSDDSATYSAFQGNSGTSNNYANTSGNSASGGGVGVVGGGGNFGQRAETRQQSHPQMLPSTSGTNPSSYLHPLPQHSPNNQY